MNNNQETIHKIRICMGSSCFARGNQENLDILEKFVEKNKDKYALELTGSRCENKCSEGPNIEIDGVFYHHLDSGSLIDILNNLTTPYKPEVKNG